MTGNKPPRLPPGVNLGIQFGLDSEPTDKQLADLLDAVDTAMGVTTFESPRLDAEYEVVWRMHRPAITSGTIDRARRAIAMQSALSSPQQADHRVRLLGPQPVESIRRMAARVGP